MDFRLFLTSEIFQNPKKLVKNFRLSCYFARISCLREIRLRLDLAIMLIVPEHFFATIQMWSDSFSKLDELY